MGLRYDGPVVPYTREELVAEVRNLREHYPHIKPHFGLEECDLSKNHYWGSYQRQSREEQAQNNRITDYLLTSALLSVKLNVEIPLEYIWFDTDGSDHLQRKVMIEIRQTYIQKRRIAGIIIPKLDRLSRINTHVAEFERRCEHVGVLYHYGDVPSGIGMVDKILRQNIALMAQWTLIAIRENVLAGLRSWVEHGNAPFGRVAIGYNFCKVTKGSKIISSHLEVAGLLDGASLPLNLLQINSVEELTNYFVAGSPAHIVAVIFFLAAKRGWSSTAIARFLIENNYKSTQGEWRDGTIRYILRNSLYYGVGCYNKKKRVANPNRPLSNDTTDKVPLTVYRLKPEEERVWYTVPAFVDKNTWDAAQSSIADASRWRGHSKPQIPLLLRGFILCPLCKRPMKYLVVHPPRRRYSYYSCSNRSYRYATHKCEFRKNIRADIAEDRAKAALSVLLSQPEVLERAAQNIMSNDIEGGGLDAQAKYWTKMLQSARQSIATTQRRLEAGLYTEEEALPQILDARRKVREAQEKAEHAQKALENRSEILASLRTVAADLKQIGLEALNDISNARLIMGELGCAYIPDDDGSGEGKLYVFYDAANPARYGPKNNLYSPVPSIRLGL